jgi:hypothetical protein
MSRGGRTLLLTFLVACTRGEQTPTVSDSGHEARPNAAQAECAVPVEVRARVEGSFERLQPRFRLVAGTMSTQPIVDLELPAPRFARELVANDLCSDEDPSVPGELVVRCLVGSPPVVQRVAVKREADGLEVSSSEGTSHWKPPPGMPACTRLVGLGKRRDLESLRATWMRDEPGCPRVGRAAVRVVLRLVPPSPIRQGALVDGAAVTLLGLGEPRSLGALSNLSGPTWIERPSGISGIQVEASDDETVRRLAYQLGDAVYYGGGDGDIHRAPLPCGARASFSVEATGGLRIPERKP